MISAETTCKAGEDDVSGQKIALSGEAILIKHRSTICEMGLYPR